jgi:hypothetical protein
MSGNGPSPETGSVTLTSSGTPSNVATSPWQKRTPSSGGQSMPNGFGTAEAVAAGTSRTNASVMTRRRI